ncbi:MAG: hypothetical protein ACQES9_04270 [Myxococcota bacterium]
MALKLQYQQAQEDIMGFFSSLFNKEERHQRAFAKNLRKTLNKNSQPDERQAAMHYLRNDGSPEAIYGLLKRFTITAQGKGGAVVDEEEKEWVTRVILQFDREALPQLKKFIFSKEGPSVNPVHSISQALQLIKQIVNGDKDYIYELFKELIKDNPPGYERDPIRKEEILNFLNDWDDPRMAKLIAPYLEDMNETIRFLTVDCLFNSNNEDTSREELLKLFLPEKDESLRIKNRIIHGFAENEWSIKGYRSYIEPNLPSDEYRIIRGDTIQKLDK